MNYLQPPPIRDKLQNLYSVRVVAIYTMHPAYTTPPLPPFWYNYIIVFQGPQGHKLSSVHQSPGKALMDH